MRRGLPGLSLPRRPPIKLAGKRGNKLVLQFQVSLSLGSDSLQRMISDPDNVIALGPVIESIAAHVHPAPRRSNGLNDWPESDHVIGPVIESIAASRCWMDVRRSE